MGRIPIARNLHRSVFSGFESGRNASVHAGAENRAEFTFNPLQPFVNAKYGISTDICGV
jgi:hypothetical protein